MILRQIKALWSREADDYDMIMLWAACCTADNFFRMGEVTSPTTDDRSLGHCVSVVDVAVDNAHNPSVIGINLHSSKKDQFSHIFLGRTGLDLCSVSALLAYLAVRGSEPGPLFVMNGISQRRSLHPELDQLYQCLDMTRVYMLVIVSEDRGSHHGS